MGSTLSLWATTQNQNPNPMTERKIIQLVVSSDPGADVLYALCDDGTVWRLMQAENPDRISKDWSQVPPIIWLEDPDNG